MKCVSLFLEGGISLGEFQCVKITPLLNWKLIVGVGKGREKRRYLLVVLKTCTNLKYIIYWTKTRLLETIIILDGKYMCFTTQTRWKTNDYRFYPIMSERRVILVAILYTGSHIRWSKSCYEPREVQAWKGSLGHCSRWVFNEYGREGDGGLVELVGVDSREKDGGREDCDFVCFLIIANFSLRITNILFV